MEAGGGDIVKDDWIEWAITPNKSKTAKSLKKTVDEIDDAILDGQSVNDMDNHYADMFRSYVDSFSPSGNIFGTAEKMVKKITKKDALRKEKLYNDQQVRALKEKEMMEWEGQFRGGKGIHSFDRGGINFAGRRQENNPPRSTNVQIKPKPLDRSRIMDAIRIQETGGEADPNRAISYNKRGDPVAYGPFQIRPGTAADAGFGVSKWPTFLQEFNAQGPDFSNKSRAWAREYLDAMFEKFGDEKRAISAYMWGPGNVSKVGNPHSDFWNLDYYNSVMGHYNRGGIARRPIRNLHQ
jgi:hypothetical protein